MLKMKKMFDDNDRVIYIFSPEGSKQTVEILLDKKTGKVETQKPKERMDNIYIGHAIFALKKMAKKNLFPDTKTVAWY
ncbi:hypothetical protein [Aerococcus christensenii]|uniref:Uncharacterized protein n=1 Tax=Aerococcus christensenii TaxID=87541 RepID=A0A133XVK1_9LACT|nr:hypothetical protein [Aerococcus christensenii]KXB34961.1 hypothetical protein HMPREF3187_01222 [Aerococcus christensenii]MDK8233953.1 hypothetical protein [Aerococcus christensenii]